MKQFRKILFWTHLTSGILAGIFIFIMCVTGALLSFESNILDYAESDMRRVELSAENAERLSITALINKTRTEKPDSKPSGVTFQNEKTLAATVSFGRDGQIFVNPYTGEMTGAGATTLRGVFRFIEDAHRWLALPGDGRTVGKSINDAANVLFLVLAVTGVYIWFPRKLAWNNFRSVLWFRRGLKGKSRNFNWHNTIGFWTSLVLIILTLTAIVMSYSWANNLLYTITGNELPNQLQRPPNQEQSFELPTNFDEIWTKAEQQTAWKSMSIRFPIANNSATFTIDEGIYWNKFGRSSLTIDTNTGEVSKWERYGEQNKGRQLRSWVRFTHTGESAGFVGQLVGFLACIGGAFLVWTGISLALRRFQNWRT